MSKIYPLSTVCLLALLGLGLTQTAAPVVPLNVKTGLWENHTTITISGTMGIPPDVAEKMTPEQRARIAAAMGAAGTPRTIENTDQGCVTQQDLTEDPTRLVDPKGEMKCTSEVVTSSASDLELHATCTGEAQMEMHIKVHAQDQEHVTGQGDGSVTVAGHTMKSAFTMDTHWLGATCPSGSGAGQK